MNVHFKDPRDLTYNETLKKLLSDGTVSTRGLKENAKVFDEMVVDINTQYFEEHGGYDYAVRFYEEAYRFAVGEFGAENIISAESILGKVPNSSQKNTQRFSSLPPFSSATDKISR